MPDRENRKAILFYEAAEGGAGVLTRLASDPGAISRVARKALEVCHFRSRSGDWSGLEDLDNLDDECEAGCYRCLLSYFNQPEHPTIDRQGEEMLDLLCRLTRCSRKDLELEAAAGDSRTELRNAATSSLEKEWLSFIEGHGFRAPDKAQPYLEAYATRPDFAYADSQTLIFIDGPHHQSMLRESADEAIDRRLADAGYTVVRFPADRSSWPDIAAKYAWVFGSGDASASRQD